LLTLPILNRWTNDYQYQLFQYGEENAVIWDMVVNRSNSYSMYDKVYTVGLFDSISSTSQIQLCSVAEFDGLGFEKVRNSHINIRIRDPNSLLLFKLGGRRNLFTR
jgi:hypothetical protein